MDISDLVDGDEEISRFRDSSHEYLSEMTARELAYSFKVGDENQRIIYREFLKTQLEEYQKEFNEHLIDPTLGVEELEDDSSEGDEW